MKRFSTLLTAAAVFLSVQTNAQYFEDFEGNFSSTANGCYDASSLFQTIKGTGKDYVINGNASAYVEPPTNGTNLRTFSTPFLDLPTNFTISFLYQLSSPLSNGAVRTMEVGYTDVAGNFTSLVSTFTLADTKSTITFPSTPTTFTIPAPTVARISIRIGGNADGNSRVVIDDISVSASTHYPGGCNRASTLTNDMYIGTVGQSYTSTKSVLDNDGADPDGEFRTVSLATPSLDGSVVFQPDGNFTFTPNAGFIGTTTTFSYRVCDNGYPSACATAQVTINFVENVILPVKLISFAGSALNNKGNLRWSVADNETGDQFEVLRSTDGKSFFEVGTVFINNKVGSESYQFVDARELDALTYYKLKIINKDGSISYSNIIALKSATDKPTTTISIMKNPVESTLTFTYAATTASQSQVSIYNSIGVKVYSSRINTQDGTNVVSLNLDSHLAAGTYILEVVNGSQRAVARMIKK